VRINVPPGPSSCLCSLEFLFRLQQILTSVTLAPGLSTSGTVSCPAHITLNRLYFRSAAIVPRSVHNHPMAALQRTANPLKIGCFPFGILFSSNPLPLARMSNNIDWV